MADRISGTQSYQDLLADLKKQILAAQVRAALAVNSELILLYWKMGRQILERQAVEGWGKSVIPKLSKDLAREFPEMKGLSPRNLGYMKTFAEAWPDEAILQQVVAKLPWGHNVRNPTTSTFSHWRKPPGSVTWNANCWCMCASSL